MHQLSTGQPDSTDLTLRLEDLSLQKVELIHRLDGEHCVITRRHSVIPRLTDVIQLIAMVIASWEAAIYWIVYPTTNQICACKQTTPTDYKHHGIEAQLNSKLNTSKRFDMEKYHNFILMMPKEFHLPVDCNISFRFADSLCLHVSIKADPRVVIATPQYDRGRVALALSKTRLAMVHGH